MDSISNLDFFQDNITFVSHRLIGVCECVYVWMPLYDIGVIFCSNRYAFMFCFGPIECVCVIVRKNIASRVRVLFWLLWFFRAPKTRALATDLLKWSNKCWLPPYETTESSKNCFWLYFDLIYQMLIYYSIQ